MLPRVIETEIGDAIRYGKYFNFFFYFSNPTTYVLVLMSCPRTNVRWINKYLEIVTFMLLLSRYLLLNDWIHWINVFNHNALIWLVTCFHCSKMQQKLRSVMLYGDIHMIWSQVGETQSGCLVSWAHFFYIVWLSLIWDTDWLNTVTWSTNISVCCPPQSCGGGTLIDTTHFFTQTNGKLSLRYYRFNLCWPS